jgi:hypothetical protein
MTDRNSALGSRQGSRLDEEIMPTAEVVGGDNMPRIGAAVLFSCFLSHVKKCELRIQTPTLWPNCIQKVAIIFCCR